MKQKVTSSDVAKKAGVSQSTVSLVLSGKDNISEEVRKRVLQVAKDMGYSGRRSSNRKTSGKRKVGMLIDLSPPLPFIWSFERPILESIEKYLNEHDMSLVILPVKPDTGDDEIYTKIVSNQLTGIISMLYIKEKTFQKLRSIHIPVIVLMNDALQTQFPAILVDDFQGVFDGITYLVNRGHRKLVYIDYNRPDMPSTVIDRLYGFKKAVEHHNLNLPDSSLIRCSEPTIDELKEKLEKVFSKENPPTAIFAFDDYIGASIAFALQSLGISVPEKVSLISMGDVLDYSIPYIPQITTVRINTSIAGRMAGRLLFDIMEKNTDEPQILKVTPSLCERGSCRKIP